MWTPSESIIETEEKRKALADAERRSSIKTLTSRRFWLAAGAIGETRASLLEYVREHYSGQDLVSAEVEIEASTTFDRDHYLVEEIAAAKGISEEELDALWEWASTI